MNPHLPFPPLHVPVRKARLFAWRRGPALIGVALVVAMLVTGTARAATPAGTFAVDIVGTGGGSWYSLGSGGHFTSPANSVLTGKGAYAAWSDRRWRLELPGNLRSGAGGYIKFASTTPNDPFSAVVRVGSGGASPRTVATHTSTATFSDTIPSGDDWVDIGLVATSSTTLASVNANRLSIGAAHIVMIDERQPDATLEITTPADWHGPNACIPTTAIGSDPDSGVVTLTVDNASTGLPVASWHDHQAGLRPGLTHARHTQCLPTTGMVDGFNALQLTAIDAGGRPDTAIVRVRADVTPPEVGAGPAGDSAEAGVQDYLYDVSDSGSGVATTHVTLDGDTVNSSVADGKLDIRPDHRVAVGEHEFAITVVDNVGNQHDETRHLTIIDSTPPVVSFSAPGTHGGAAPWLQASASDVGSDIDATSWHVLVDGEPVPLVPVMATISGPLGMLTAGHHVLTIVVADASGNVTTIERGYLVDGDDSEAGSAAVGGQTGLFIMHAPTAPVVTGRPYAVSVLVATAGRPLAGYRVVASDLGVTADAITDARGVARISLVASVPTVLHVRVSDAVIAEKTVQLHVAARLHLHASHRRAQVGAAVVLRGDVSARHAGQRVQLEARIGSSWYPLRRSVRISRHGKFRTTVTSSIRGLVAVRVVLPARSGWSVGTSNVVMLTVR